MTTLFNSALNLFLAIVLPVQLYLLLIGGVILADTYYGVLKSKSEGEKFDLTRMLKGIVFKMAVYTPAMLGVYWLNELLMKEMIELFITIPNAFVKLGCAVLISTELSSINDNLKALTGRGILSRLKSTIKGLLHLKKSTEDLTK